MADSIRMDGRVAIVTGAGRGLGRSHAIELARRGARVLVNDIGVDMRGDGARDDAPANEVVAEIVEAGGTALASRHDIGNPEEAAAMIELAAETWGRIDILVNNAGNNRRGLFSEITLADLRAILDVHVIGAFVATQTAFRHMARSGYGRVVMTTSQVGFYGKIDSVAYGAAKAALVGLLHGIKLEAASHGIGVNAIAPFAMSRMSSQFPPELGELMDPAAVSAAVVFLCSESCLLNGEILTACGGHFGRALMVESQGVDIGERIAITPEGVRDRWDRFADMGSPEIYPDAVTYVQQTFARLKGSNA